ncbi:hypothetical protein F53441_1749 [Fusarium austroafricanum]|uniref:Uncharacterized protein n=1 Tax=Fusarium austroafricanum TaxID=2364996 RepID=A0A8H4KVG0_9HYPO|nr:hypothetical protein F53441_1749 [Fusarium austroafricanum]
MAHQADKLPWEALASLFELRQANSCQHDAYNLHARIQPDGQEKLTGFIKAFMECAGDEATRRRKLYPEKYDDPDGDEVIITDEVAKRITPTISRCDMERHFTESDLDAELILPPPSRGTLCPHTNEGDMCECSLPFKERKMSAFQRRRIQNDCYEFMKFNGDAYRNLEVVKTLLIHCEVEPILRSCADKEYELAKWWSTSECYCASATIGWVRIYHHAIEMYLILNILYCFPDVWNKDGFPVDDYRNLKAYQRTIWSCTKRENNSEVETFPHRDFFGIESTQFRSDPRPFDFARWKHIMKFDRVGLESYKELRLEEKRMIAGMEETDEESDEESDKDSQCESDDKTGQDKSGNESEDESSDESSDECELDNPEILEELFHSLEFYPYGLISYQDFLDFENPADYQPHANDIIHIRWILGQKGLPAELADDIIEYADYVPTRSLPLSGKPLHPQCRTELGRYLEQCWQIIVSCIMLGNELGEDKLGPETYVTGGIEGLVRDSVEGSLADMFQCGCDGVSDLFRH